MHQKDNLSSNKHKYVWFRSNMSRFESARLRGLKLLKTLEEEDRQEFGQVLVGSIEVMQEQMEYIERLIRKIKATAMEVEEQKLALVNVLQQQVVEKRGELISWSIRVDRAYPELQNTSKALGEALALRAA